MGKKKDIRKDQLLTNVIGYWEDGQRHGEGVFTYPNQDIYSGLWKFNEKEGVGTYVFFETGMKVS